MREVSVYCSFCGAQNADDANFCFKCGKELSAQSVAPAEPSPQVHHPWMTAQPSQPSPQEETPQEEVKQDREMPEVLRWIQGWSTKKKVLWGIVAGFLFLVCVSALVAEPVEEEGSGSVSKSLQPPKELIPFDDQKDNPGWKSRGLITAHLWHDAADICERYEGKYPDYSETRYKQMIDEAHLLSQNLELLMPSFSELHNLQTVYAGTLESSDTWADAYHDHDRVKKMFNESSINILKAKFGTSSILNSRVDNWVKGNDGSAERAQYQHYADNVRMLWGWFYCGTAKVN